jgi:hypothetical protein
MLHNGYREVFVLKPIKSLENLLMPPDLGIIVVSDEL